MDSTRRNSPTKKHLPHLGKVLLQLTLSVLCFIGFVDPRREGLVGVGRNNTKHGNFTFFRRQGELLVNESVIKADAGSIFVGAGIVNNL